MTAIEERVAAHYTTTSLLERIRQALIEMGIDPGAARPEDLKPVDEFHTAGVESTEALLDQLEIGPDTRVLDIGSGLGGTARLIAARHGASVTGVDLTPAFVETAAALSDMVGLGDKTRFEVGSALDLPVEDHSCDLALLLHVGMNVRDKRALFGEARRALAPSGTFAIFEVMRGPNDGALQFPYPWAEESAFSFVEPPDVYRGAADAAGFMPIAERDRSAFAIDYFTRVFAALAENGPPALGIHLLMRDTAPVKLQNYFAGVKAGLIAPVEMIFRAA